MTMYIYSTKTDGMEERLLRIFKLFLPEKQLKFYRSIDDFSNEHSKPLFNPRIVILLILSRNELEDILSIKELLEDTKIILILPDTKPATLAKGHTLKPRFLCDCNSDFVDVAAVLKWMIRRHATMTNGTQD